MKTTIFSIIQAFCLIFFVVFSPRQSSAADNLAELSALEIARSLSDQLSRLDSLRFTFTQTTSGQLSGRTRQASGQAYFVREGETTRMRWNYQPPERQVIISDGEMLTMYFENLKQMIIAPADRLQQDVTYSFFTGKKDIEDEFIVQPAIVEADSFEELRDSEVIKLIPKSFDSQISDIRLWITGDRQLKRIEIIDNFETVTILNLNEIEENSLTRNGELIDKNLFVFEPPQGTEIIRQ